MGVKVQLRCGTGKIFVVDIDNLKKFKVVYDNLIELGFGYNPKILIEPEIIPLPNMSEQTLSKLIEYCTYHRDDPDYEEDDERLFSFDIGEWDMKWLKSMNDGLLFDVTANARYLDMPCLINIVTTYVAMTIADADDPEEQKRRFGFKERLLPKDLTTIGNTRAAAEKKTAPSDPSEATAADPSDSTAANQSDDVTAIQSEATSIGESSLDATADQSADQAAVSSQ